jgi:HEAT repeat protein
MAILQSLPCAPQKGTDMKEAAINLGHNAPPEDADPLLDRLQEDHVYLVRRQAELLAAAERAP